MELSIDTPSREITPRNGNETLDNLSGFPVFAVTGISQVQVRLLVNVLISEDVSIRRLVLYNTVA